MENRHGQWLKSIPLAAFKSQQAMAEELGMNQPAIAALKSGQRGLSVDAARKVAARSGEKPATVYIESQIASLKHRTTVTKSISGAGILGSCQHVMRNITTKFRDEEIDQRDPAFRAAAENLKKIAVAALEMAGPDDGDVETVHTIGDSVEATLKKTLNAHDRRVEWDAHGRAMPEAQKIEGDAFGRAI